MLIDLVNVNCKLYYVSLVVDDILYQHSVCRRGNITPYPGIHLFRCKLGTNEDIWGEMIEMCCVSLNKLGKGYIFRWCYGPVENNVAYPSQDPKIDGCVAK